MDEKEKLKRGDVLENVSIEDAASDGKSIARVNGLVIFISGGVPGDSADIRIDRIKKNYAEGTVAAIRQASPDRVHPFCEHFGICGGCSWQHLSYPMQLHYKQKQVEDALIRLAKLEAPKIRPILAAKSTTHYRNRLDFAFGNRRWLTQEEIAGGMPITEPALGFHLPKRFDKILDIRQCHLMNDLHNEIRLAVKEIAMQSGAAFFHPVTQEGMMRNMLIRTTTTGEWMVAVIFKTENKALIHSLLEELASRFPQVTSLLYLINPKRNDTFYDLPVFVFKGDDFITEEMPLHDPNTNTEKLKFRISAKSFYQTNSLQAFELYKTAREFAALGGNETVYDLYTGTGTIAQFVSFQAKKVVGIEQTPDAIEDAKANSLRNGISNTVFLAGDIKDTLTHEFVEEHGKPDVVITDPPRAGMHEDVVNKLREILPQRIVYVSCNPATQARDLALLTESYEVMLNQPVDMFPHTTHVENVALLRRKG